MTDQPQIRFPSITIIDDTLLFDAFSGLTPRSFKLFLYLYHKAQNYEEAGCGYELEIAETISNSLKIPTKELTESFRSMRDIGWIQAFTASIAASYTDDKKEHLIYRWCLFMKPPEELGLARCLAPSLIEGKLPETEARSETFIVVGTTYIPPPQPQTRRHYGKHWRTIRVAALERDGNRCVECDDSCNLHIHHLTYENEGNEKLDELITLCGSCHGKQKGGNG